MVRRLMFGIYRYALAMLVMFSHLMPFLDGTWNWLGVYAVFSFYSLSGYLMALILHGRYGFDAGGLGRYLANRALRLYPAYWVAMLIALLVAVAMPSAARVMDPRIGVPSLGDWPRHLLLLGLHWQVHPVLIPPAWSLHVEVAFYLLMGLGLARSRRTTSAWLLASVAYTAYTLAAGWEAGYRYPTIAAAALPFSLGASAYLLQGRLRVPVPVLAALAAVALVNAAGAVRLWSAPYLGGFYLHCLLGATLVYGLAQLDARAAPATLRALDRAAGDLAYPIFLLHYPVAILLVGVAFAGQRPLGWALFLVALPCVHVAAWLLHRLVEVPVETVRRQIRGR
jgi:peptidoglycan/LPS O-acetylase OafA/YrhL